MKKVLLLVTALCLLVVSGCTPAENTASGQSGAAVDAALVSAIGQPREEAIEALGLTEDMIWQTPEGPGYVKKYNWCGRDLDTYLYFPKNGTPNMFLVIEDIPYGEDAKAYAEDCTKQFMAQFGTPMACSKNRDGHNEKREYYEGVEAEMLEDLFAESDGNFSEYSARSFRFPLTEESTGASMYTECGFYRLASDPEHLRVRLTVYGVRS